MNHSLRWLIAGVLCLAVLGLLLWARGLDHHHGDEVGALGVRHEISQRLER